MFPKPEQAQSSGITAPDLETLQASVHTFSEALHFVAPLYTTK